jgi:protein TonB
MLRRIACVALFVAIAMPSYAQTDIAGEWRKQISIRLSSSKRFPLGALGQRGTTKVGFIVDRNGKLVSRWLEESTGIAALDEESLAIVERAQPFPIPPPELGEDQLRMTIPLIFDARPAGYRDTSPDLGKMREILHGEDQVSSKMRSICRGC